MFTVSSSRLQSTTAHSPCDGLVTVAFELNDCETVKGLHLLVHRIRRHKRKIHSQSLNYDRLYKSYE